MLAGTEESRLNRAARALRGWGLDGVAATLLEDGGPLTFLGAQALYFAAPVLDALGPGGAASDLAAVLDDPATARALAAKLRRPASAAQGETP